MHCFEAIDKYFRDILRVFDPKSLGDDFKKILPVILDGT